MHCPACNHDNPAEAKFCLECGGKLALRCAQCDAELPANAKFCSACGASVHGPGPGPTATANDHIPAADTRAAAPDSGGQGERRQLTVLFCDLVGSTEIASRMDPEEWRDVAAQYQRSAADVVQRFGGHVAKYLGDGLLVLFGYPQAHDDDAERALRAGLAIVDAMRALNERLHPSPPLLPEMATEEGTPTPSSASTSASGGGLGWRPLLSVRVGIHTGLTVVADAGDKEDVFGDTPNIAARVQAAAEPDTVLITGATHRLVSGLFIVDDRGPRSLKGVQQPVNLFRVRGPSGVRGRLAATAHDLTPFVGREDERRLLVSRWEQAREAEGQLVLMIGEAGIGKSRLVQTLREHLRGEPHTWVECAGSPYCADTPFYAVTDMLGQALMFRDGEAANERITRLEASLAAAGLRLEEAMPLVAPLLNLPVPSHYADLGVSPEAQRKRLLTTLVAWLFGLARLQPAVVVLEDLHWVDASTLELQGLFAEQVATAPILFIYTARPEFSAPWPLRAHHTHLSLNRLSRRHARTMVQQVAMRAALKEELVEEVVARTDGVPLFLEELTKAVLEAGGGKELTAAVPTTLRDSLMARLDRLGSAKDVAQTAAVIGREFSYPLIRTATGLPDDALQAALARLADAELLYARGFPPDATYVFKHALVRDTAYESLLRSRRRELHALIAGALAAESPQIMETNPEVVAHHYTEGGRAADAVMAWYQAGQRALSTSANEEAVHHLRRGLEALSTLPSGPEHSAQELAIQMSLGLGLVASKGYASPDVEQTFVRAEELCRGLGEVPQLFPVQFGLWMFHMTRADALEAPRMADRLLTLAKSDVSVDFQIETDFASGIMSLWEARHDAACARFSDVLASYDRTQHRSHASTYGQDPAVYADVAAAWSLWMLGYPDQALQRFERGLAWAEQLKHPFSLAGALNFGACLRGLRREGEPGEALAIRLIALAEEQSFPMWHACGLMQRGAARVYLDDLHSGYDMIREGLARYRATGAAVGLSYFLAALGEALFRLRAIGEGLAAVDEWLSSASNRLDRYCEPELHRLRGELLLADGKAAEGEACLTRALEIARSQQARSLELRAAMSLARLWLKRGNRSEARELLGPLYGWFTEGFDTRDLIDAKALLEELDTTAR